MYYPHIDPGTTVSKTLTILVLRVLTQTIILYIIHNYMYAIRCINIRGYNVFQCVYTMSWNLPHIMIIVNRWLYAFKRNFRLNYSLRT